MAWLSDCVNDMNTEKRAQLSDSATWSVAHVCGTVGVGLYAIS